MGTCTVTSAGTTVREDGGRAGAPSQEDRGPATHADLLGKCCHFEPLHRAVESLVISHPLIRQAFLIPA